MKLSPLTLPCPLCDEPVDLPAQQLVPRPSENRLELRLEVSSEQLVEHLAERHGIRRPPIVPPGCPACGGRELVLRQGRWCCQKCPAMFTLTPVAG